MRGGVEPVRKVPTTIELWKRFAGRIESDLLSVGLDIADWHQGTRDEYGRLRLSSRRLLVVLENLSDRSAFRTALRGGRQSRRERVVEELLNEAMRLRSSTEAIGSRGEVRWDPADFAWRDPVEQAELDRRRAVEQAAAEEDSEDLYADLGFT